MPKQIVAWSPFLRQPAHSNVLPAPPPIFSHPHITICSHWSAEALSHPKNGSRFVWKVYWSVLVICSRCTFVRWTATPQNVVEGLYKRFIDLYWLFVAGVHLRGGQRHRDLCLQEYPQQDWERGARVKQLLPVSFLVAFFLSFPLPVRLRVQNFGQGWKVTNMFTKLGCS